MVLTCVVDPYFLPGIKGQKDPQLMLGRRERVDLLDQDHTWDDS